MQYLRQAKLSLFILGLSLMTLGVNQLSALAQTRQPTNAEIKRLRQELQQDIRLIKNNSTGASYLQDTRTQLEKNTRESFVSAWSKTEPRLAPFFGIWGGYESVRHIYPSNIKGRVCVVKTGEGYGSVTTGIFSNGVIKTNVGEVLFKEGNYYLGAALLKNGKFVSDYGEIPLHSPSPLEPLNKLLNYIFEPSEKNQISQQFKAAGCTSSLPTSTVKAQTQGDTVSHLPDGNYVYGQTGVNARRFMFRKKGNVASGFMYNFGREECFKGFLEENTITKIAFASYDSYGNFRWDSGNSNFLLSEQLNWKTEARITDPENSNKTITIEKSFSNCLMILQP
jgi:hypothetical protein